MLVDKLFNYGDLAGVTGRAWPVLFWLHSAVRERHLHHHLNETRIRIPVATAARDHTTQTRLSPADAVWWLHHHPGALLRLIDLATIAIDRNTNAA